VVGVRLGYARPVTGTPRRTVASVIADMTEEWMMTGLLSTVDYHTIRDLVSGTDPLAAVYFGLWPSSGNADASEDLLLRWRAISARLGAGGAGR
jgi:hypothetical protein